MDHVADTNIKLLFPSIAKQTWNILKGKWLKMLTLVSLPIVFAVGTYAIIGFSIYVWAKMSGVENFFFIVRSLPQNVWAVCAFVTAFVLIGLVYFSLRSTIASVRILESNHSIRHAWKEVTSKNILSFFIVSIMSGLIFIGGYMLLFIPFLFLITFYINAMFANLVEGKNGLDAFVVSRHYVKGYGTTVFVNLLFVFAISAFVSQLIVLVPLTFKLLNIFVAFGKVSPISGIIFGLLVLILVLIALIFLKVYVFSFLYVMFKKLQALKSSSPIDMKHGRKAAMIWLWAGIFLIVIFACAQIALERETRRHSYGPNQMMQSDYGIDNDGYDPSYIE